jgi:hypothetical protein
VVFKNGQFRDLYNWHSLTYSYWPIWARQLGCMLQILPIILVPLGCVVQTWRYLSSGPRDILDVSVGNFSLIICPVYIVFISFLISLLLYLLLHNFVFLFSFPFSSFVTLMPKLYHSSLGWYEKVLTAFKAESVYHLNVLLCYSITVKRTVTPNSEHLGVNAVLPEKNGFHVSSLCCIPNQPIKQLHGV